MYVCMYVCMYVLMGVNLLYVYLFVYSIGFAKDKESLYRMREAEVTGDIK